MNHFNYPHSNINFFLSPDHQNLLKQQKYFDPSSFHQNHTPQTQEIRRNPRKRVSSSPQRHRVVAASLLRPRSR